MQGIGNVRAAFAAGACSLALALCPNVGHADPNTDKAAAEAQARREALEAQRRTLEAKAAAEQGKEEEKARLTEQARIAEEEQRQKDRVAIEAAAAAEQAARDKARAEAQAKAAEDAKRRAEEKARKAQERKHQRPPARPKNLLPADKPDAAMSAASVTRRNATGSIRRSMLCRMSTRPSGVFPSTISFRTASGHTPRLIRTSPNCTTAPVLWAASRLFREYSFPARRHASTRTSTGER